MLNLAKFVKAACVVLITSLLASALIVQASVPPVATAAAPASQPSQIIPETIPARLDALRNLAFSFDEQVDTPGANAPPRPDGKPSQPVTMGSFHDSFSRLDDMVFREHRRIDPNPADIFSSTRAIFTGDHFEFLMKTKTGFSGSIEPPRVNPSSQYVQAALGLMGCRNPNFLTRADIGKMQVTRSAEGHVLLERTEVHGLVEQWELNPGAGYATIAYRTLIPPDRHVNIEVRAENVKPVKGLMLPSTVHWHILAKLGGQVRETMVGSIKIQDYKLNDPDNTPARYHMVWPPATEVTDSRVNMTIKANDKGQLQTERHTYEDAVKALAPAAGTAAPLP